MTEPNHLLMPRRALIILALLASCSPDPAMQLHPTPPPKLASKVVTPTTAPVALPLPSPQPATAPVVVVTPVPMTQPAAPALPPPTLTPYTAFAEACTQPTAHVVPTVWFTKDTPPSEAAAKLLALPKGQRALFRWGEGDYILNPADKPPFLDKGAAAETAFGNSWYPALKATGATVDYLQLDTECGLSSVNITDAQYAAASADPRWPALAAQYGVTGVVHGQNTPAAQAESLLLEVTENGYLHSAFYGPLLASYPAAHCGNCYDVLLSAALAPQAPDANGCVFPASAPLCGDLQCPAFYGDVGNISSEGVSASQPLSVLCWSVNRMRAYIQGAAPVMPWVAGKSSTASALGPNSPYYDELIFHLLLSGGTTNLNLFDAGDANGPNPAADCAALDSDLAAVQAQAGGSATLKPLTSQPVAYTSPTLISGATLANGHKLYRVTVATSQPTTQAVSVTLPGDSAASSVSVSGGAVGAWVQR